MNKPGDYVSIKLKVASMTATPVSLKLFNADETAVTLGSTQRLLIDTLRYNSAEGSNVTFFSDKDGGDDLDESEIIWQATTAQEFVGGPEGFPCPVGKTPKVRTTGVADTVNTVEITGTGRIVHGQGDRTRPSWREDMSLS
jgi:hypothetical protein